MFIRANVCGFTSCFKFVSIFLELFHLVLAKATKVFSFEMIVVCKNFFNECLDFVMIPVLLMISLSD